MGPIDQLSVALVNARSAVAFCGAGISTESGIPDFRSPGGVWSRHQPILYEDFLRSRAARVQYWKLRRELYRDFAQAQPNDGHRALARLEQQGKLAAVITQNIDGLHQAAGSRRVIELHGTAHKVACVRCAKECSPAEAFARLDSGDDAPDCTECGAPLKSKTISFGQAMPHAEMAEATQLTLESDLFLAIGSSLVVEPAASLPRLAMHRGATLMIINGSETPLDQLADLFIQEPIGRTLRAVCEAVASGLGEQRRVPTK